MYTTNIKKEVATLRIFAPGDSYEMRSTPVFSCTVHYISDTELYFCNAVGEFSRFIMRAMRDQFSGYTKFTYERHGSMKEIS